MSYILRCITYDLMLCPCSFGGGSSVDIKNVYMALMAVYNYLCETWLHDHYRVKIAYTK